MTMQTPQARRYSRIRDLGPDPRVQAIREAVRKCSAGGRARAHTMAGDSKLVEQYVALLDDLAGSLPEELIGVGDAMREAAFATALAGSRLPAESTGEVLALEAIAEGAANRDTALLIDAPHCESRKRAAVRSLSWHDDRAGQAGADARPNDDGPMIACLAIGVLLFGFGLAIGAKVAR